MFQHGLLILTYAPTNPSILSNKIGHYLRTISSKISKTLYVSLEPNNQNKTNGSESFTNDSYNKSSGFIRLYSRSELIKMVPAIYAEAHRRAPFLDVRVLHHWQFRSSTIPPQGKRKLNYLPEIIFVNDDGELNKNHLNEFLYQTFDLPEKLEIISLSQENNDESKQDQIFSESISDQIYDRVCLGGTFDNLHNGHKILLSTSQLKCNHSLTIGVTNEDMVKNKKLRELIDTPNKRMQSLTYYIQDVDPFIEYKVCQISDPFGPAIVDGSLQAIIVSEETLKGGQKINEIRKSKGMSELKIDVIKLLEDEHKQSNVEEEKVSSSSLRIRKLGTLLKNPEPRPNLPKKPYLIGLTGMIASGKTSVAKKLGQLGAGVINVDLLAHKTYENQTSPAYKKLIETFGKEILDENGQISRPKLGTIVFNDDSKLKMLNEIIWPEVKVLVQKEIERMKDQYEVIVLEIALLIEGAAMDWVHQIWLIILDEKEILQRLMRRNQLTETEAMQRIQAQMPAIEKMKYANVVFCTHWEEEFTWIQIRRAWDMLQKDFIKNS